MEFTQRAGSHQKTSVTYSGCKFALQRWSRGNSALPATEVCFDTIEVGSHKSIIRAASCGNTLQRKSVNLIIVARAMICLRLNNAGVNEIDKICYSGSWLADFKPSLKANSVYFEIDLSIASTFTDVIVNFDVCLRRNRG